MIGITESWLTPDISDGEILPYGYQIFRNDRLLRNGGGTLLAVKNCITACRFDSPITTNSELEFVAAEVQLKDRRNMLIAVIYRPPSSPSSWFKSFEDLVQSFQSSGSKDMLLLGDFNLPNINWLEGSGFSNSSDLSEFCDFLCDSNLFQLVDEPTRSQNVLDLLITNMVEKISGLEVSKEISLPSDHHAILFELQIHPYRKPSTPRVVYNFKNGDFDLSLIHI